MKFVHSREAHYRMALFLGWAYMLTLIGAFFFLNGKNPDSSVLFFLAVVFTVVLPLGLGFWFSFFAREDDHFGYYITGIPALFGILAQYLLLSFIPIVVRPPGVMVHILGSAGPFDIPGQIAQAAPILGWAILTMYIGLNIGRIGRGFLQYLRINGRLQWRSAERK